MHSDNKIILWYRNPSFRRPIDLAIKPLLFLGVLLYGGASLCADTGGADIGKDTMLAENVDPASAGAIPLVPQIAEQGYQLVFSDEFKKETLDTNKWGYRLDVKGTSAQVEQNVSLSGGMLHLAVKREEKAGKHYTGGGIISKKQFEYGYYEARFKVPPGSGWHTSFWTMWHGDGNLNQKKSFAQEIDICEQDSNARHSGYSTGLMAWNTPGPLSRGRVKVPTTDLSSEFHVWSADYSPSTIRMYFDGKLVDTIDVTKVVQGPQNIWLTVIGWGREPDQSQLPSEAQFSYVRVFQKPK